jgi:hypothetical protein
MSNRKDARERKMACNRRDTIAAGRVPSTAERLVKVEMLATGMTPATTGPPAIALTPATTGIKWRNIRFKKARNPVKSIRKVGSH